MGGGGEVGGEGGEVVRVRWCCVAACHCLLAYPIAIRVRIAEDQHIHPNL